VAELTTRGSLEFLELDELSSLGAEALISTRGGGDSRPPWDSLNIGLHVGDEEAAVLANRELVAAALGRDLDQMIFLDQVHGTRVAVVDASHAGRGARSIEHALSATDAAITTSPEVTLVIQMADCAPLVLFDPAAGVLGVAHAGWRGATAGIAGATVDAMVSVGAEPARIHAGIGPCVDPTIYEVGPEVIEAVEQLLGEGAPRCVTQHSARVTLDLGTLNELALEAAGIPIGQVHRSTHSTADRHLFFSDRHARPCGRFALFARLSEPDDEAVTSAVR